MGDYVVAHESKTYSATSHNPFVHMGIGFAIVTVLEILALNVVWWPLMPIGVVASYGAFIGDLYQNVIDG